MRNKPKAASTAAPKSSSSVGRDPEQNQRDRVIALVAKETLGIETLLARGLDQLDVDELSVHQIREAPEQAYDLGREAVTVVGDPPGPVASRPPRH